MFWGFEGWRRIWLICCCETASQSKQLHNHRKIAEALIDRQKVAVIKLQIFFTSDFRKRFLQNITVPILEDLRVGIRSLVRYIDKLVRKLFVQIFKMSLAALKLLRSKIQQDEAS